MPWILADIVLLMLVDQARECLSKSYGLSPMKKFREQIRGLGESCEVTGDIIDYCTRLEDVVGYLDISRNLLRYHVLPYSLANVAYLSIHFVHQSEVRSW